MRATQYLIASLSLVSALAVSPAAKAATLDFSDLASGACNFVGSSVASGGFNFVDGSGPDGGLFLCNAGVLQHNTTPAMVSANGTGVITLSSVGGGSFSLQSFFAGTRTEDFNPDAPSAYYGQATGINILGALTGGGFVSDHISFVGLQFDMFTLVGTFTGLDSVTFTTDGPGPANEFMINNIVVNAAVPEPASLALLAVGLAGIGMIRRRQTR